MNTAKRLAGTRRAALAGMAGPALFASGLTALTALQYGFMVNKIGWQPIRDPAGAWPSGLSLGPYGWAQDLNFALSGLLLANFAAGLGRGMGSGPKAGPALLSVAGLSMALMDFETDPIDRTGPRTLHGWVHDAAFVVFVLSLLLALFFLWRGMRKDPFWRGHARYTLTTTILAAACLALPGVAYYLFLVAVLVWFETTALRLYRLSGRS